MKIVSKDIMVQISFMGRNLELTFCLSETIILPAKIELETNHAVYLKIKQAFFFVCFMFVVVVVVVVFLFLGFQIIFIVLIFSAEKKKRLSFIFIYLLLLLLLLLFLMHC